MPSCINLLSLEFFILTTMSGFMVPTQGRSLLRFFAIDSEIFPLIATVSLTAGAAGYFAGTRQRSSDRNVVLAQDGHPWSMSNTDGSYKYRFYKHGDPKAETLVSED